MQPNSTIQVNNQSIAEFLSSPVIQQNIESVLKERSGQFITSVTSLVNSNEALQHVERKSLFAACLTAASLDLPINANLGFAYIIPYKDKAQFQMGYKGYVQLAMRSGKFKTLNATDVREGEITSNNRLTGDIEFSWIETNRDKSPIVGYVAYMRLVNGFEKSLYMTVKELNQHGLKYSQSMKRGYGLWKDDFDAMAKKTVIKLLLSKYAPLTTDMQTAQLADQAVITDKGFEYPDNKLIDATEVAGEKERARVIKHIEDVTTVAALQNVEEFIPDDEVRDMYNAKLQLLEKGTK